MGASHVQLEFNLNVYCECLCAGSSVILWKERDVSALDLASKRVISTCLRPYLEKLRMFIEAVYRE